MNLQIKSLSQNSSIIIKDSIKGKITENAQDQTVIANLLSYLEDTLPNNIDLAAVEKLIDLQAFTEARNYLKAALLCCDEQSLKGKIHFLIARCCHGLELLQEAIDNLNQALYYQPNNIEYWNLQADCYLEMGDWQQAVTVLNKSVRSSPRNAELIYRLGSIFLFYGEYAEALNCFSGCCQLKPFNAEYWEMKAEMLLKLLQISEAVTCFKKAIKYGGQYHLYSRLAYCYAILGKLRKAKKILLKVLNKNPDDYDALNNLAGIYHKLGNNEQAYKLLKKALTLNANDPLLYNNLGMVCHKLHRTRKAIEYYKEALKIDPSDTIVLYNLASCLVEKGLWEEAKIYLEKLLAIESQNSDAWILLGNIYEHLSRPNKAIDCFNHSLGLA
ncbi:MAG: tetratricopeptide repeat protein [Peptococcaceae bacterium]|nr:tetratricopeptide repeat protein [Peptococcaceae bacterium]